MKILKIIGNSLFGLIAIFLFSIIIFSFFNKGNNTPKIGNYSLLEVKGSSMYPKIKNGDLIVIDRKIKDKYEVGDMVSFYMEDGTIITHKIVLIEETGNESRYFTKGINNSYQDNDYIEIKQIIGEYKNLRIPLLGYVVGFSNTIYGYILVVIVPLVGILSYFSYEILKELLKKRGEE